MIVPFLRIEEDHTNKNIWYISCIAKLKAGYDFLIVCSSFQEAQDIVLHISNEILFYPTTNPKNFIDITSEYPFLQNLTKVYRWSGQIK